MPRIRKKTSKRGTTRQREKIKKKVSESRRKAKKAAQRNPHPQWKSKHPKDPGIPNSFPYKAQILAEIAEQKRQEEEEKRKRREEKKAERAETKAKGKGKGKVAAVTTDVDADADSGDEDEEVEEEEEEEDRFHDEENEGREDDGDDAPAFNGITSLANGSALKVSDKKRKRPLPPTTVPASTGKRSKSGARS